MRHRILLAALITLLGTLAASAGSGFAADGPTILKDSLVIQAHTVGSFHGDRHVYAWKPQVIFRVNGPLESGSMFWMEIKTPAGGIKFDIPTEEIAKGRIKKFAGGSTATHDHDIPDDQAIKYTRPGRLHHSSSERHHRRGRHGAVHGQI